MVSKLFDLRRYKKQYVIWGTFSCVYGSLAFLTNDDFIFPPETFPHGFISNKCSSLPTFPFAAKSCHPFTLSGILNVVYLHCWIGTVT